MAIKCLIGLVLVSAFLGARGSAQERRDEFYYLGELNKASSVMVVEQAIVPKALGRVLAESVSQVIADGDKPGAKRPGDYLELEKLLVTAGGADVTRMHSGRSRQDIGATRNRLFQRAQVLTTFAALNNARAVLLDFAAKYPNAIVPAYTVGVQAQPISLVITSLPMWKRWSATPSGCAAPMRTSINRRLAPRRWELRVSPSIARGSLSCSALTASWKIPWTRIRFRPSTPGLSW
jgi:hypothetical protein